MGRYRGPRRARDRRQRRQHYPETRWRTAKESSDAVTARVYLRRNVSIAATAGRIRVTVAPGEYAMSKSTVSPFNALRGRAEAALAALVPFALLLGRFAVGLLFVSTGWGKVHDIPKVVAFFVSLGIPAPGFHAVLVSWSELLCGSAIVIGLLTRLSTIPLIVSMTVALLTAKRGDIHGLFDLVGQDEFTYLVVLMMIAVLGPGKFALDHFVAQRLDEI